ALRYDSRLLLGRPSPSTTPPGDHLDTTIGIVFLPGIKHGICHRLTSNDQLMPSCIAGEPRDGEVGVSYRLRFIGRRDGDRVRLFTRRGHDWTDRVPRIATALYHVP